MDTGRQKEKLNERIKMKEIRKVKRDIKYETKWLNFLLKLSDKNRINRVFYCLRQPILLIAVVVLTIGITVFTRALAEFVVNLSMLMGYLVFDLPSNYNGADSFTTLTTYLFPLGIIILITICLLVVKTSEEYLLDEIEIYEGWVIQNKERMRKLTEASIKEEELQ